MHVARLAVWVYWVYLIYCSENALRMQLYYMQSDARPQFSNQMIVFIRIPFQFLSVWCCWEKIKGLCHKGLDGRHHRPQGRLQAQPHCEKVHTSEELYHAIELVRANVMPRYAKCLVWLGMCKSGILVVCSSSFLHETSQKGHLRCYPEESI
jgi:hypothetical protein